jgi:hypothetical protein
MITFSKLGYLGRLGNQLFEIASTIGLARKYDHEYIFPEWQYAKYFKSAFPVGQVSDASPINERHFHYHDWPISQNGNYDLKGYLQSEKYWQQSDQQIRELFTFREDFSQDLRNRFIAAFQKPVIAVYIRRGDYVGNPNYAQLPVTYYVHALFKQFPNWLQYNILFISDDLPYCRIYFNQLPNAYFTDGLNEIEHLCLMSQCDHFIIANSTFGWWGAWLGEKAGSKIVRPAYHFDGPMLMKDSKDIYPQRWTVFDHKQSVAIMPENKK